MKFLCVSAVMLLSGASAHFTRGRVFRDAKAGKASSKAFKADKEPVESGADLEMMMLATAPTEPFEADFSELEEEEALEELTETSPTGTVEETGESTSMGGMNTIQTEIAGEDNAIRLLKREGIISEIPTSLCEKMRKPEGAQGKNVILVVGDGMGWEMARAGAVAKRVIVELESMGIDIKNGTTGDLADAAKAAFAGRTLDDYYTEGKGSGLSFQNLPNFYEVTTSTPFIGEAEAGNHYGPARSFLGDVDTHDNGMGELLVGADGKVLQFDPRNVLDGGNMVLWDDAKGGSHPWDPNYFKAAQGLPTDPEFDPLFIMQHAIDSANSAAAYSTGVKTGVNMMGVDLYERPVRTILEEAMSCDKAAGIMTSVPILHATPGAFVSHTNYRKNMHHLQDGFRETQPTWAMGTCASIYQPTEELKQSMIDGILSSKYSFLYQDPAVLAENFYDEIQDKDPNKGESVLACFGGQYSTGKDGFGKPLENMPFRGTDSSYTGRWCSAAIVDKDEDDVTLSITPNSTICNHWPEEELVNVPHMHENVKEALNFLGKSEDGFFLMYEQGDIDWAAHANMMDDLVGAMLDIDEGVAEIMAWIDANGGFEKNALYVTADHDHYLTLLPHFPEVVANMIIDGVSHNLTPSNNTNTNTWEHAISAGRHEDDSKTQTEHLKDFSTWTDDDIQNVAHYFGPYGSGGNGWGSHSTRPIITYAGGDDGCLDALVGKGYRVLGHDVEGSPGKIDEVHVNACMMKNLFGL